MTIGHRTYIKGEKPTKPKFEGAEGVGVELGGGGRYINTRAWRVVTLAI